MNAKAINEGRCVCLRAITKDRGGIEITLRKDTTVQLCANCFAEITALGKVLRVESTQWGEVGRG